MINNNVKVGDSFMRYSHLCAVPLSLALLAMAGCNVEAPAGEPVGEELGKTEAAFTGYAFWEINEYTNNQHYMGTASPGTQCLLQGVANNVEGWSSGNLTAATTAYTYVDSSHYMWVGVQTDGLNYTDARAACIYPTADYGEYTWQTGINSSAVDLGVASSTRHCYLSRVTAPDYVNGSPQQNYRAAGDVLTISQSGGHYWLSGAGNAGGAARCVDITTYLGYVHEAQPSQNWSASLGASQSGKVCFLTQIGGILGPNTIGVGAVESGGQWTMHVGAGQTGTVECAI